MRTAKAIFSTVLLCLVAAPPPAGADHCGTPVQKVHTYGGVTSPFVTTGISGSVGVHMALVFDHNTFDCDGNGLSDDFDGDYESGIGGAFFGTVGNEEQNALCAFGLHLHGGRVTVSDISGPVAFAVGYEVWLPPDGLCDGDGVIGDDPEDCLEHFFGGSAPLDPCADGPVVGHNVHAGSWIFVGCYAYDERPEASCAVSGTVTVE